MALRYLLEERTILEHGKTVETVEGVNAKLPPDLFLPTRPDPTSLAPPPFWGREARKNPCCVGGLDSMSPILLKGEVVVCLNIPICSCRPLHVSRATKMPQQATQQC